MRYLPGKGILVALATVVTWFALGSLRPAHATPTVSIQIGSGAAMNVQLTYNSSANDYEYKGGLLDGAGLLLVDIIVKSNAPGTPTLGQLMTVNTDLQLGLNAAVTDVSITTTDSAFTQPTGNNLKLESTFVGTAIYASTSLDSAVIANNKTVASITGQALTSSATPVDQSFSNAVSPFTITNTTHVSLRDPASYAHTTATTSVLGNDPVIAPAPSSLVVACSGLGLLGLGRLRRRLRRGAGPA